MLASAQWVTQPINFVAPSYVVALHAADANTLWVAAAENGGATRTLARSTDGGTSWTIRNPSVLNATEEINALTAISPTTAWIATRYGQAGGRILRTTDGGLTWQQQTSSQQFGGPNSYPNFVHFFSATEGVSMGNAPALTPGAAPEIYTTTDGGATWTTVAAVPVTTSGSAVQNPPAVVGSHLWFSSFDGYVYHSPDRGRTWTASNSGAGTPLWNLTFRDAQHGLASYQDPFSGGATRLFRTTDGGSTWTAVTGFSGPLHGAAMQAVPGTGQYLSVGGSLGSGLRGSSYSRDNGQTWVPLETQLNHLTLCVYSPTAAWSGALDLSTGTPLGVHRLSTTVLGTAASAARHAQLAYPNPSADGIFHLGTGPEAATATELRVRDALGREVHHQQLPLAEAAQAAGRSLNLSGYPAGLYTLELRSAAGVVQQKLVIQ
ncbi:hypothetical protein DLM85_02115 [Hymenobacter edaphi]|uniref:Secretion system C-terminal sorting domain-containing protein n=1 Tax=Hymenobacter edaphi TaxID=2211146 RepID=A0A328BUH1_9BACT|nr:hypothetical protein DLM85_02115 [Hymenobacter edaphi]